EPQPRRGASGRPSRRPAPGRRPGPRRPQRRRPDVRRAAHGRASRWTAARARSVRPIRLGNEGRSGPATPSSWSARQGACGTCYLADLLRSARCGATEVSPARRWHARPLLASRGAGHRPLAAGLGVALALADEGSQVAGEALAARLPPRAPGPSGPGRALPLPPARSEQTAPATSVPAPTMPRYALAS
ncbi:unnamed protein product, partial [Prorocentrum cordatum]